MKMTKLIVGIVLISYTLKLQRKTKNNIINRKKPLYIQHILHTD